MNRLSLSKTMANFQHGICRKHSRVVMLTFYLASFGRHVCGINRLRAWEQMGRTATRRIVARMANLMIWRNFADQQFVGDAMGFTVVELPIAISITSAGPENAAFFAVNLGEETKETILDWLFGPDDAMSAAKLVASEFDQVRFDEERVSTGETDTL